MAARVDSSLIIMYNFDHNTSLGAASSCAGSGAFRFLAKEIVMGSISEFLKHVPDAATSPLAFVAYVMVLAAWVLTTWLRGLPERKAQQILKQFGDDQYRLEALKVLVHQDPPAGLTGNDAILGWVTEANKARKGMLLLVALGITLVAVIVFSVSVEEKVGPGPKQVSVNLHRSGTAGDCPILPEGAHLVVYVAGKMLADASIVENCKATFAVSAKDARSATLSLTRAGSFILANEALQYQLSLHNWDVYLTTSDPKSRLRISLFDYSGKCSASSTAYATFRGILESKVNSLRGIFAASDHRYDYLRGVNIVPVGHELDLSSNQIEDYWNGTSSLQVLSGLCFPGDRVDIIHSQVFSGALSGGLSEPFVAEIPLSAEEFGTTRDIHTVSVLYALSQEALGRGLEKDIVISYLSHAREAAIQIGGSQGQELTRAIDMTLKQVGAPKPMVLRK
jgi:hypothetical protein